MFEFEEETLGMTAAEILNYYRNKYYAEPLVTERGIVANAINDVLPNMVEVVRCKDCKHWYHETAGMIEHYECSVFCDCYGRGYLTGADDFCSYGERKKQK